MKPKNWISSDLIVSEETPIEDLAFPKSISTSQMTEDIDFLIYTLSTGYPGKKYAPSESYNQAIKALRDISEVSNLAEFHEKIDTALFLIPDNHLSAVYKGRVSTKRQNYLDENKISKVGHNNISNSNMNWEVRLDQLENKKILYISFTRFRSDKEDMWDGLIASIQKLITSSDSIVFDLRGCLGGSDDISIEIAKLLYGRSFEHGIKNQYRSLAPETLALLINQITISIINMNFDKTTVPNFLLEQLNEYKMKYSRAANGDLSQEYVRKDKGGSSGNRSDPILGYHKPIYILTDRVCTSACEYTAAAFEWHPNAKRVGDNTSGTFHFSNAGILVLPNSKFKVYVPTQYSEYYDRRFIERTGLTPDIKIPTGTDAYDAVKKLISHF